MTFISCTQTADRLIGNLRRPASTAERLGTTRVAPRLQHSSAIIFCLHKGHVRLSISQESTHAQWNSCAQGKIRTRCRGEKRSVSRYGTVTMVPFGAAHLETGGYPVLSHFVLPVALCHQSPALSLQSHSPVFIILQPSSSLCQTLEQG